MPGAAFFDLDRTLISGSSAFDIALAARKAGYLRTTQLAREFPVSPKPYDQSTLVRALSRVLGEES